MQRTAPLQVQEFPLLLLKLIRLFQFSILLWMASIPSKFLSLCNSGIHMLPHIYLFSVVFPLLYRLWCPSFEVLNLKPDTQDLPVCQQRCSYLTSSGGLRRGTQSYRMGMDWSPRVSQTKIDTKVEHEWLCDAISNYTFLCFPQKIPPASWTLITLHNLHFFLKKNARIYHCSAGDHLCVTKLLWNECEYIWVSSVKMQNAQIHGIFWIRRNSESNKEQSV